MCSIPRCVPPQFPVSGRCPGGVLTSDLVFTSPDGCKYLNTTSGPNLRPIPLLRVDVGGVVVALRHLRDVWAGGDIATYQWLLGRLALLVQYPRHRGAPVVALRGSGLVRDPLLSLLVEEIYGPSGAGRVVGLSSLRVVDPTLEGKSLLVVDALPTDSCLEDLGEIFHTLSEISTGSSLTLADGRVVPNFLSVIVTTSDVSYFPVSSGDNFVVIESNSAGVAHSSYEAPNPHFPVGLASSLYTYLLRSIPRDLTTRGSRPITTGLRRRLVRSNSKSPSLYYGDLVDGRHIPSLVGVVSNTGGRDVEVVEVADLYVDFARWCRRSGNPLSSREYFTVVLRDRGRSGPTGGGDGSSGKSGCGSTPGESRLELPKFPVIPHVRSSRRDGRSGKTELPYSMGWPWL